MVASDERSQARNRELALRRLADRLRDGAARRGAAARRPRPTQASVQRRLKDKRRQADRKADRRRPLRRLTAGAGPPVRPLGRRSALQFASELPIRGVLLDDPLPIALPWRRRWAGG